MADITTIRTEELEADLLDGEIDVRRCLVALACDVTEYSGGSVADRLETNLRINERIRVELARRQSEAK